MYCLSKQDITTASHEAGVAKQVLRNDSILCLFTGIKNIVNFVSLS